MSSRGVVVRQLVFTRGYITIATCIWPCVRLCLTVSVTIGVLSKRLKDSGCFLVWGLPLTYPTLCCKEIQVPSK